MPIITISRDSYSHGREIAEQVAKRLDCECVAREMVLEAAEASGISQTVLQKALHDAPSFLEQLHSNKERHVALFKASLYRHLANGCTVYHGLAGHVFTASLPQVLKVRVVVPMVERLEAAMSRDNISERTARRRIAQDDRERRAWSKRLYGMDNRDPKNYDLCVNLRHMSIPEAIDAIVEAARKPQYQADLVDTFKDMAFAAEAEARLLKKFTSVQTSSKNGELFASINGSFLQEDQFIRRAHELLDGMPGLTTAHIGVTQQVSYDY